MGKPYIGPKNRGSALGVGGRSGSRSGLCIRGRGIPWGHTLRSMDFGCSPPEMDPQDQRVQRFPGEVRCIRPKGVGPVRGARAIAWRNTVGSPAPPRPPRPRNALGLPGPGPAGFLRLPGSRGSEPPQGGPGPLPGMMRSQDPTGIGRRRRARGRARALLPQTRAAPPQPGPPWHLSCGSCASPSRGAASPRPPSSLLRQRLLRPRRPASAARTRPALPPIGGARLAPGLATTPIGHLNWLSIGQKRKRACPPHLFLPGPRLLAVLGPLSGEEGIHSRLLNSLLQASKKSPSLLRVLSLRAYLIGYCSRNSRLPKPLPEGRSPPDGSV